MKRRIVDVCSDLPVIEDVKRTRGSAANPDICGPIDSSTQPGESTEEIQRRLSGFFYDLPCEHLAQHLLGKVLVRRLSCGSVLKGRIVETECYLGGEDRASHSYNGKRTPRNAPMYMKPGTVYVYFTYGMYFCFNISSQGDGAAVLIRAVDPLEGLDFMLSERLKKRNSKKNASSIKASLAVQSLKPFELCNGPGKLCISFSIDEKTCNMQDLSTWDGLWIEDDGEGAVTPCDIIVSKRVGIDSVGGEWVEKPLRYYIFGNRSVSRRDRLKEKERMACNTLECKCAPVLVQ